MVEAGKEALRERLIGLVEQTLGRSIPQPFPAAQKLSELGMSSIQMVNLMLGVEIEFDVAIPQADITPENFFSLNSILALMLRLKPPQEAEPPTPAG